MKSLWRCGLALGGLALGGLACSSTLDVGENQRNRGDSGTDDSGDTNGPLDPVGPGGNTDPHGTLGPPGAKRMFVTSATYTGDLVTQGRGVSTPPLNDPGADAADKLCATAAVAGNLGGTWKAWISSYTPGQDPASTGHDALDRIADVAGGWYNVDRTALLFTNKANLTGVPNAAEWREYGVGVSFVKDEHGNRIKTEDSSEFVWTGTATGGRLDQRGANCGAWTKTSVSSGGVGGTRGYPGLEPTEWTEHGFPNYDCAERGHLYCFEQ